MKKEAYKKELLLRSVQRRNGSDNYYKEVMKIQSWLTLFSIWNPNSGTATAIDGDFGPATEKAVKNFQQVHQMEENGYVDQHTFNVLTLNLKEAFEKPLFEDTVRGLLIEAANNHLMNYPFELEIRKESNSGPWVRSYMDGNEGNLWYWCMGFVQTIIDQVWSHLGKDFRTMMPLTYSCDTVGNTGLQKGVLYRYQTLRKDPDLVKPGDLFLLQRSKYDWIHTGIIVSCKGAVLETIEGNTNYQGSRNGIAVMKRTRNLQKSRLDVFSLDTFI